MNFCCVRGLAQVFFFSLASVGVVTGLLLYYVDATRMGGALSLDFVSPSLNPRASSMFCRRTFR